MVPINTEFYRVQLVEAQRLAILDWKKETNHKQYQEGCSELYNLLNKYELRKCLIKTGNGGEMPQDVEDWGMEVMGKDNNTKEVLKLQLALVMSEEEYGQMVHNYSLSLSARNTSTSNYIQYFTKEEEALDWLSHGPHLE